MVFIYVKNRLAKYKQINRLDKTNLTNTVKKISFLSKLQ